ncbi:BadF/BadG/BcrA/BcrD ATPase family protein [Microbacterium cremeum]|uniref:BadF/BadG/BcrA/BcrD ATPase family protein n=1 Tax=Microbacterium cremeum TaxID=2782169 RepID=UPI00188763CE|nr:BadF/BadG/BcrA/BcrD ATPase family protein [Microbacterium cremeum]
MSTIGEAVLVVDGGQSAVRVRHSSGVAADAPGVSWGGADTVAATADAVLSAWRSAGSPLTRIAVLGLTTVPEDVGERDRLAQLIAATMGAERLLICDDGVTSHAGALGGGWGIVLAVGTGVACVARPRTGGAKFIGGHGFMLGDEGGAFWIGRAGLAAALRAADGRGIPTRLQLSTAEAFGDVHGLHIRIHADPRAVDRIARFAPAVIHAAREGDPVAREILDTALVELTACVRAGWAAAGREPGSPLAVVGRLAEELRPELEDTLRGLAGLVDLRAALGGGLDGAERLAFEASAYGDAVHVWAKG